METVPRKPTVVFFTASGHTQAAAEATAKSLNAALERIEAAKPVPHNMFLLMIVGAFAALRKRAWAAKPASRKFSGDDLVIIGTPVWAGSLNPVVRGWLQANPIPADVPYAAFVTMGKTGAPDAIAQMTTVVGHAPFATMAISDADRKSGADADLIERFVAEIRRVNGDGGN
jgi:flavodoxin